MYLVQIINCNTAYVDTETCFKKASYNFLFNVCILARDKFLFVNVVAGFQPPYIGLYPPCLW